MNELVDLILDISREVHSLQEFARRESRKISDRVSGEWVNSRRAMTVLKISKRTMQDFRDNGVLPYSKVKGKFFYKAEDLVKLMESNYFKKDYTD